MKRYEQWLLDLTNLPTAAGREDHVISWVKAWATRTKGISLTVDRFGNLLLTQVKTSKNKPIYITAHLDHPAFVVRKQIDESHLELEFRGGVNDAYFVGTKIEVFDDAKQSFEGTIVSLQSKTKPFKRVKVKLKKSIAGMFVEGDIARWKLKPSIIKGDLLHAPACDDLAGVAAALGALDKLKNERGMGHVGVLLTRAEEIGFVGAIAAANNKSVPKSSRLLCLETSRSFPESPIGGGPILRVGDKTSVFGPELTNTITEIMNDYQKNYPKFQWQRKLMPGGTCESTAFCQYGYLSTCLCLPLGNYHNMRDIDGVLQKKKPAKIAPEVISVRDYHGLIKMLVVSCIGLDKPRNASIKELLKNRLALHKHLLD